MHESCSRTEPVTTTSPPLHPSDPRVPLALERTFLAWIRTSLALMAFGVVVVRFSLLMPDPRFEALTDAAPPRVASVLVGLALVGVGTFSAAYSVVRFRRDLRGLARGESPLERSTRVAAFVGAALAAVGILTVIYFLTGLRQ